MNITGAERASVTEPPIPGVQLAKTSDTEPVATSANSTTDQHDFHDTGR